MTQDKECNCDLLGKQIINATEGSYTTSIDFHCPVHGMQYREFEKPSFFGDNKPQESEWAKEFDEIAMQNGFTLRYGFDEPPPIILHNASSIHLKSFITSLLTKQKASILKEVREVIEGMKIPKGEYLDKSDQSKWGSNYKNGEANRTIAYNQGLQDLLTKLEEMN